MTSVQESNLEMNQWCPECGAAAGDRHKMSCDRQYEEAEDEQDFLVGVTCNPNAPEECESCQ